MRHGLQVTGDQPTGRKPAIFHYLMSRFREIGGKVQMDNIEKEFIYTNEMVELMKVRGKMDTTESRNAKCIQEETLEIYFSKLDIKRL